MFKLARNDARDFLASRKKVLHNMRSGRPPGRMLPVISKIDGVDTSSQQILQSNLDTQTRVGNFESSPEDHGVNTHVLAGSPEEATGTNPMLPIRSDHDRAQPLVHSSRSTDQNASSSIQTSSELPQQLLNAGSDRNGSFMQSVSVPLSPKHERNIGDPHDLVRLKVVQPPNPSGTNEVNARSTNSPMSVNPLVSGAGTEFWRSVSGWGCHLQL